MFLVMSAMLLIFIYFCAVFFGDVHLAHLYIFLCYVFWWCPCCSSLYISVLCFLVMSMLLIFIYFCVLFFGDVNVAHLYIFLCFVFWWCPSCSSSYIFVVYYRTINTCVNTSLNRLEWVILSHLDHQSGLVGLYGIEVVIVV
jgi:hypothetical protein